jgi:cyclophilin family peptidyl-prolyl cis-trans isomerase
MTIDQSKTYTATVKTDVGTITIALDAKDAPKTVNSFVFLADHSFFNCEAFMRVIPQFMDQTGSPNQSNGGSNSGPGYEFANENDSPKGGYTSGEVAMANSGANTNGSQFFILVGPYSNTGYSLFGHVTSGQSVVQAINNDGTSAGTPTVTHRMLSVTISES